MMVTTIMMILMKLMGLLKLYCINWNLKRSLAFFYYMKFWINKLIPYFKSLKNVTTNSDFKKSRGFYNQNRELFKSDEFTDTPHVIFAIQLNILKEFCFQDISPYLKLTKQLKMKLQRIQNKVRLKSTSKDKNVISCTSHLQKMV